MMVVLFERLFCTAKTAIPPEAERKEAQSDYAKVCEMPLRFFACIFLRLFAVSFFTINYQLPTINSQLSLSHIPSHYILHPLLSSTSLLRFSFLHSILAELFQRKFSLFKLFSFACIKRSISLFSKLPVLRLSQYFFC